MNKDSNSLPAAPSSGASLVHWLPAAFLVGVVGLGAVFTLLTPEVRQWPTGKNILTGEAALDYEKNYLDAKVPWRDASVQLWGSLNYRLFGEARDGAVVGKGGWLFTTEEFQTSPKDAKQVEKNVVYITHVRDQLAKGGAQLVVALLPAKTRIYADQLGSAQPPASWQPLYASVRAQLVAAGIEAPDLAAEFTAAKSDGKEVFLRTDTHWSPDGARVAAEALAPVIRSLAPELSAAQFQPKSNPPTSRKGDLMRYVPVPEGTGPAPDTVTEVSYEQLGGGGGLLGDETIEVTLVGTSYSAETAENVWHFDGALANSLGAAVLNMAKEGKGPIVPMREYLTSPERTENPPRVVVWEIPERFLRVEYRDETQAKQTKEH